MRVRRTVPQFTFILSERFVNRNSSVSTGFFRFFPVLFEITHKFCQKTQKNSHISRIPILPSHPQAKKLTSRYSVSCIHSLRSGISPTHLLTITNQKEKEPCLPSPPKTAHPFTTKTGAPDSPSPSRTVGHSPPTPGTRRCSSSASRVIASSPTTAAETAAPASHGTATTWITTPTI